jgi:hypothetical protein
VQERYSSHLQNTSVYFIKETFLIERSATDHIFCIHQILEKKWECSEAVHLLFMDFKKAYDTVRMEVVYDILTEFGIPMKLVRLIKNVSK